MHAADLYAIAVSLITVRLPNDVLREEIGSLIAEEKRKAPSDEQRSSLMVTEYEYM